jgi:hypothetical protein
MDDYYGFASFFAGVNMKRGVEGREVIVYNNNAANTVEHPVDGRRMKPKELGGAEPEVEGQDPRRALAAWMTSGDDEAFRQTMANVIGPISSAAASSSRSTTSGSAIHPVTRNCSTRSA